VLLLNSDATIEEGAVSTMLRAAAISGDIGSVAAQMRFKDGPETVNSAGIVVDRLGIAYDRLLGASPERAAEPAEVFGASGGACLLRRAMLDDVGGFDETFFLYMEDADLAWRARMRGWRALYEPGAVVRHRHSATTRHGSDLKYFHVGLNRVRMLAKNATTSQLLRYGLAMAAYDIGYVLIVAGSHRTLAPLRGRLRGVAEWRRYRRRGQGRVAVELAPVGGIRAALARRAVWTARTAAPPT
jgi:GT2 family glycosyltransferase